MATVDAAGEKKPMGTIAKGLNIRCEQKFRLSHRRRIESGPWLSLVNNVDGQTEMWRCGASFESPNRVRENRFFCFEISSQHIGMTLSKLKRKTLAYGQSSFHQAQRDFANPEIHKFSEF
jgi:hypothetical protein